MIDVFNKKISLEIGKEKITFKLKKSMKYATFTEDKSQDLDLVNLTIHDHVQESLLQDQLDSFLLENVEEFKPGSDEIVQVNSGEINKSDINLQCNLDEKGTPYSSDRNNNMEKRPKQWMQSHMFQNSMSFHLI